MRFAVRVRCAQAGGGRESFGALKVKAGTDSDYSSKGMPMRSLATELWPHGQIREIACCVCQSRWNEMLLSAMLRDDRRHLGSICPRCLNSKPRRTHAHRRPARTEP